MKYPNHIADMVGDVYQFFMLAQPELQVAPHDIPPKHVIELCKRLIDEEVNKELFVELDKLLAGKYSLEIMANIQDAYIDTIYVSIWAMVVLNLPVYSAWNEVQKANMAKFPIHEDCQGKGCSFSYTGARGNVHRDLRIDDETRHTQVIQHCANGRLVTRNAETGKVMKPEGWQEPASWDVLYRVWNIYKLQNDPDIIRNKDIQKLEGGD